MKTKDSDKITDILFNKTILDMDGYPEDKNALQPSEYLLFVKDTYYNGDLNNKLSLIIIDKNDGYVVNNNLKFNSLEVIDNKLIFYTMINSKRREIHYWFKKT